MTQFFPARFHDASAAPNQLDGFTSTRMPFCWPDVLDTVVTAPRAWEGGGALHDGWQDAAQKPSQKGLAGLPESF